MSFHALAILFVLAAVNLLGQGAINFNNRVTGTGGVVAPVYGPEPSAPFLRISGNATTNGGSATYHGELLLGTGYTAELWAAPVGTAEEDLVLVSTTTFRTLTAFGGFIQPPVVAPEVPGVPIGERGVFQLRVWDNRGGTIRTWAEALADGSTARGFSDPFVLPPLGSTGVPLNLVGLQSFSLTIPEPNSLAVGAAGLLICVAHRCERRKRQ